MKKFLFILMLAPMAALAQIDSQSAIRENPTIDTSYTPLINDYPAYVRLDKNKIDLNGDDWSTLARELGNCDSTLINIVHIGDSHLQADMATAVTRTALGNTYGSAGRGLTVPFKLAGTNEPVDYTVTSPVPMVGSRLLRMPWPTRMGFTGIAVEPQAPDFGFTIVAETPFDSLDVFFSGDTLAMTQSEAMTSYISGRLSIKLPHAACEHTVALTAPLGTAIHGFNLVNGHSGLAYHVIGNNGATYSTYNALDGFGADIARLSPRLIIVSLGTNEAFGKVSDSDMRADMHALVNELRRECPDAKILLTTPSECQRKMVTTRRRGKKRRRRRVTTYAVNANVARLRNVILEFGRAEGLPVYDFYAVAGGYGSSAKWLRDNYLNTDRIHLTRRGYTMQGQLFTDALLKTLNSSAK